MISAILFTMLGLVIGIALISLLCMGKKADSELERLADLREAYEMGKRAGQSKPGAAAGENCCHKHTVEGG